VGVVFELVMSVRQRWRAGGPAARDPTAFILSACIVAAVIAAELLGRKGRLPWPGGLVWPVAVGLVLIASGIGLRVWSIATLGRFFQYQIKVQPGHRVVTGGAPPYLPPPSFPPAPPVLPPAPPPPPPLPR